MIRVKYDNGRFEFLHMFLAPFEVDCLGDYAAQVDDWKDSPHGSGIFCADVREDVENGIHCDDERQILAEVGERALDELRRFTGVHEFKDQWKAQLVYYANNYEFKPLPQTPGTACLRVSIVSDPSYKVGPGMGGLYWSSDFKEGTGPGSFMILEVSVEVPA